LKHFDVTPATYKREQMKHLKHAYKTLEKNTLQTLKIIVKYTQHQDKTFATDV
jgi:hypothetical protein